MAEVESYTFNHKELVEMMVKHQQIHSGIWELIVEFGLAAQNIIFMPPGSLPNPVGDPSPNDHATPAAIVGLNKIGIKKIDKLTPLSVDASKVNPEKIKKK
mgnify:CR=1 FL=1